jgi:cell division protein FtsL
MVSTFTNRSLRKKEQMESENYNIDFSKTALEQTTFGKTVCNS